MTARRRTMAAVCLRLGITPDEYRSMRWVDLYALTQMLAEVSDG